MKKGDIVLCADKASDFTSKPRPAVVVQNTAYIAGKESVIVCPISTVLLDDELAMKLLPTDRNGLHDICVIRADKLSAVKKSRVGKRIGALTNEEMRRLDEVMRIWLNL